MSWTCIYDTIPRRKEWWIISVTRFQFFICCGGIIKSPWNIFHWTIWKQPSSKFHTDKISRSLQKITTTCFVGKNTLIQNFNTSYLCFKSRLYIHFTIWCDTYVIYYIIKESALNKTSNYSYYIAKVKCNDTTSWCTQMHLII